MRPSGAWRSADVARLRDVLPRGLRHGASLLLAHVESARVSRQLQALAADGRTILAGPWLGEVGFELLYWAPFLAWFVERFAIEPSRLLVLSRGGTQPWYPVGVRYQDVLDYVTPEAFKAQHDKRVIELGEQKQSRLTAFDRELVAMAAAAAGSPDVVMLHPAAMYHVLRPFWWGHVGTSWVHAHARYRQFARLPREPIAEVPDSYVAVKFYFNDCFPATAGNRAFVRETIAALAARGPVVSLSGGLRLDDHGGCPVAVSGVVELAGATPPSANLRQQSAIVANARAFVGTYGGFAYLAPFYGVPAESYYSDAGTFSMRHLDLAREVLARTRGAADLQVGPVA